MGVLPPSGFGGIATETINGLLRRVREDRQHLLEPETYMVCGRYDIPVAAFRVADDEIAAVRHAEEIGFPVVLKVVSPDILHKSDVGGVILNLTDPDAVRAAYRTIHDNVRARTPHASVLGVLVQEMIGEAHEVIVGAKRDPQFGPVIMFGLGGIFVELLQDTSLRIAPLAERDAHEMIREVKGYAILQGYRGGPPADIDAIGRIILGISTLMMDHASIQEVELNPIMVDERGAKAVDARMIL